MKEILALNALVVVFQPLPLFSMGGSHGKSLVQAPQSSHEQTSIGWTLIPKEVSSHLSLI